MKQTFIGKLKVLLREFFRSANKHRITLMLIAGSTIIFVAFYTLFLPSIEPIEPAPARDIVVREKEPTKYYSPLTGREVGSEEATKALVTAIMIENSPDARPQSGLKQADVIYEAIAEGGITRFLALYQESKPSLIGPVRSVREYFVDWLTPYNPSIAHVGGSKKALTIVRNGKYRDIDQFFNSSAYWRSSDRYAPHNVYTSFKRLDALNREKGFTESNFSSFPREDTEKPSEPTTTTININFSSSLYNTEYRYNANSNNYVRYQAGEEHLDREAGKITPSVIIALKVNEVKVMEDGYRESIKTSGTGDAYVFQNGQVLTAKWHKESRDAPLKLSDGKGNPIALARGQTWIAAVPISHGSVSWE